MLTFNVGEHQLIIDKSDMLLYIVNSWSIVSKHNETRFYCHSSKLGFFHRIVINAQIGDIVDHKNGNGLDNRKENLRIVSNRHNSQNTYLRREGKTSSKYIGVTKSGKKWRARHWNKNTGHKCLGSFNFEEDAAKAYDLYVINNVPKSDWGLLNFIGDSKT
jgi:hypothetical protein